MEACNGVAWGVWGVWGVCVRRVWKCGACGCVCGREVCVHGVGGVGRSWGVCEGRKERVSLAPLHYADTLVNPDTGLGRDFAN